MVTAGAKDRRFLLTDLVVGLPVAEDHPFVQDLLRAGGEDLLSEARPRRSMRSSCRLQSAFG